MICLPPRDILDCAISFPLNKFCSFSTGISDNRPMRPFPKISPCKRSRYILSFSFRYKSLGPHERRCLDEDEDKILSTVLHNMIAFMLMVQIDKIKIRRKIGRLLGKSHIGLYYTQHINTLLDNLEKLVSLCYNIRY